MWYEGDGDDDATGSIQAPLVILPRFFAPAVRGIRWTHGSVCSILHDREALSFFYCARKSGASWRAFVHGGILQTQPHLLIRNRNGTNPITSFTAALFAHVFSDSDKYPPRTPDGNGGPKRRNMPFEIYRTDIIIGQNWRRSILNISHWVLAKVGNSDWLRKIIDLSRLESAWVECRLTKSESTDLFLPTLAPSNIPGMALCY